MSDFQTYAAAFEGKQLDLANILGISRPYMSLLVAGKKRPSLELAVRIEQVTGGAVPVVSWVEQQRKSSTE